MIQLPTKSHIKLNRRGLTELVLACAFLSLLTFAVWSWQNNGSVNAMESAAPGAEVSIMSLALRHPAIMASTVVTEFILLLAFVLAIVPITWWLRTDYLIAGESTRLMTPLRWLGGKLRFTRAPDKLAEAEVQGEYVVTETGERVFVPVQGVDGEVEKEVVMVEQPDGTVMAMIQQADGTMAPAPVDAKPEAEGQTESNEPLLPIPGPTSDILDFNEEEEEDPLADLADLGNILTSAFDDENAVDPEREAISRSLDDIDIMALVKNAHNVLATFKQ